MWGDVTPLAAVLAIWNEVLEFAEGELGADSNFFLSGGDSLQLARVLVRVRERLGANLDARDAARLSTPGKMAACCVAVLKQAPMGLRTESPASADAVNGTGPFPCTAGQTALWLAEQLSGGAGLYNTAVIVHLRGELQVPVLARALHVVAGRHEMLRASLRFDAHAQRLYNAIHESALPLLDVLALPPTAADAYLRAEAAQPFDLASGPLWRCRLVAHAPRQWSLLLCVHHCIADGWSGGVLLRHLAEAYNALSVNPAGLPEACDQEFRQFCRREVPISRRALQWWRARLDGADRLRSWPWSGDHRWPFAMASEEGELGTELLAHVHAAMRASGVAMSAFLLCALRLALLHLYGVEESCIGMPVSTRDGSAQEEGIGCFVNLLVLRDRVDAKVDGGTLLRQVQHSMDDALRHRAVALSELARHLQPRLLPSGNPWCDVLFAYQNLPPARVDFAQLHAGIEALALQGQYPLKVEFLPEEAACRCRIEYASDVMSRADAHGLLSALRAQLAALGESCKSCEDARTS